MMATMKSINSTLTGLTSSLLMNIGLTGVAQRLDPLGAPDRRSSSAPIRSAELCVMPCNFSRRKG